MVFLAEMNKEAFFAVSVLFLQLFVAVACCCCLLQLFVAVACCCCLLLCMTPQQHTGVALGLLVGCLTSQQHASVSQGRICSDNFTCCHTEIEVADQTFHLTQSQYTDTRPTSPSADPITPGAWQCSHWSANV